MLAPKAGRTAPFVPIGQFFIPWSCIPMLFVKESLTKSLSHYILGWEPFFDVNYGDISPWGTFDAPYFILFSWFIYPKCRGNDKSATGWTSKRRFRWGAASSYHYPRTSGSWKMKTWRCLDSRLRGNDEGGRRGGKWKRLSLECFWSILISAPFYDAPALCPVICGRVQMDKPKNYLIPLWLLSGSFATFVVTSALPSVTATEVKHFSLSIFLTVASNMFIFIWGGITGTPYLFHTGSSGIRYGLPVIHINYGVTATLSFFVFSELF